MEFQNNVQLKERPAVKIDIKFVLRDLGQCELAQEHRNAKLSGTIVLLCKPEQSTKIMKDLHLLEKYKPGAYYVK